jgi:hypothetical protein
VRRSRSGELVVDDESPVPSGGRPSVVRTSHTAEEQYMKRRLAAIGTLAAATLALAGCEVDGADVAPGEETPVGTIATGDAGEDTAGEE